MAQFIMLGTLFALVALVFVLVIRFDPEARGDADPGSAGPGSTGPASTASESKVER